MELFIGNQRPSFRKRGGSANVPLEFCRIEKVYVCSYGTDYIKTVVVPEIAAVGGIGCLVLSAISDSGVRLLIAAAKPETVGLCDDHLDPTSTIFEGVKNLHILVHRNNLESYWRTKKLFELARNRKRISFQLWDDNLKQLINWLKGEKTGTLERLSFIAFLDLENRITLHKEMEDLMKSHIKTDKGYIVERGGDARLHIRVDYRTSPVQIHFSFS